MQVLYNKLVINIAISRPNLIRYYLLIYPVSWAE